MRITSPKGELVRLSFNHFDILVYSRFPYKIRKVRYPYGSGKVAAGAFSFNRSPEERRHAHGDFLLFEEELHRRRCRWVGCPWWSCRYYARSGQHTPSSRRIGVRYSAMDGTHTTFRRLSDRDVAGFRCAAMNWVIKHPAWKFLLIAVVVTVCLKWITK